MLKRSRASSSNSSVHEPPRRTSLPPSLATMEVDGDDGARLATLTKMAELQRSIGKNKINIMHVLRKRELGQKSFSHRSLKRWGELAVVRTGEKRPFRLPVHTKATISVCFSPNGEYFASTHGDHTVRVCSFFSRRIRFQLQGHKRTPWTVQFHPTKNHIIASGCLGFQVRVWDTQKMICHRKDLKHEIISLTFDSTGSVLFIASGQSVWAWDYSSGSMPQRLIDQFHMFRCVSFTPLENRLITGIVNPSAPGLVKPSPADITVRLLAWDVDIPALRARLKSGGPIGGCVRMPPAEIASNAILYNDGGISVSPHFGDQIAVVLHRSDPKLSSHHEESRDFTAGEESEHSSTRIIAMETPQRSRNITPMNHQRMSNNYATAPPSNTQTHQSEIQMKTPDDNTRSMKQITTRPMAVKQQSLLRRRTLKNPAQFPCLCLLDLRRESLGKLLQVKQLVGGLGKGFTSVKFSPTMEHIVIGYGIRDRTAQLPFSRGARSHSHEHRVAAVFEVGVRSSDEPMYTVTSQVDDSNIALFHPKPGNGILYGTRQGTMEIIGETREDVDVESHSSKA